MLSQITGFNSFYGWIEFHCLYVPHILYPFLSYGHLDCFNFLDIMNIACCHGHGSADLSTTHKFHLL
jgi:uncharacterized membrane protein YhdT